MSVDIEGVVRGVLCDVLGVESIDPDASFTDLGGVSIEAEQIAARLHQKLAVEVSALEILGTDTMTYLTQLLRQRLTDRPSYGRR